MWPRTPASGSWRPISASGSSRFATSDPATWLCPPSTCRGNFRSTWLASGSYDYVAETAFSTIDVDGFFLEYDDERSGGFEPLRYIPKGKRVVLGLVSSKVPELEKKEALKRRIEAASRFVPLENLCLSPQCGFSSTHHGNNLTVEQEKAKLTLCIDTAREVWGSL